MQEVNNYQHGESSIETEKNSKKIDISELPPEVQTAIREAKRSDGKFSRQINNDGILVYDGKKMMWNGILVIDASESVL